MEQHLTIKIAPKPAPRPRFGNGRAYNKVDYTKYLEEAMRLLSEQETKESKEGDWNELAIKFYFDYPKSTPKKNRKALEYLRTKCDCDNLVKPIMDAMEKIGWLRDDRQISKLFIVKMQGELEPRIEISLYE